MNDTAFTELLARRSQRPLTPEEAAGLRTWLATHPADRARWAEEIALHAALARLPQPPVPSNFMARVWQDLAANARPTPAVTGWRGWFRWPALAPQFAGATLLLLLAVLCLPARRARTPAQLARSVERVTTLARVPSVELLKDFEAINRLSQPGADLELLAAFAQER